MVWHISKQWNSVSKQNWHRGDGQFIDQVFLEEPLDRLSTVDVKVFIPKRMQMINDFLGRCP